MKPPDKIYIAFENGFVAQTANTDKDAAGNSIFLDGLKPYEYIRKDALLEWAKEELAIAKANIKIRPYEEAYQGHKEKLEELIEHIESL